MPKREWRAEEGGSDPVTKRGIWARIQYFKNGTFLHDVRFVPTVKDGKQWVMIAERIIGDFIPRNRYVKMRNMALAITRGKQEKPLEQPDLPYFA